MFSKSSFAFVRNPRAIASSPAPSTRGFRGAASAVDRKSTRLNSSHSQISYAVLCLKKKIDLERPLAHLQLALLVVVRDALLQPRERLAAAHRALRQLLPAPPHGLRLRAVHVEVALC